MAQKRAKTPPADPAGLPTAPGQAWTAVVAGGPGEPAGPAPSARLLVSREVLGPLTVAAATRAGKPARSRWETAREISGILDLAQLAAALGECARAVGLELDWERLAAKLGEADWILAVVLAKRLELPTPPLPSVYRLSRQQPLKHLRKVAFSVGWGYEDHDLELGFGRWLRVLKGEACCKSSLYSYEGAWFCADWRFDVEEQDQLYVGYDDGGEGWSGSFAAIEYLKGPEVAGIDLAAAALASLGEAGAEEDEEA